MWPAALVVLALSGLAESAEYAYTVKIPPSRMECYFQNVTNERFTAMEIDFQVIDGGDMNINFMVVNPAQTTVAQFLQRTDGTQRIEVQVRGDYQICFDNTASYQEGRTVFFEIFLYDKDGNLDDDDFGDMDLVKLDGMPEDMDKDQFTKTSSTIKSNLNKAEHFQALLRAWESRDRAVMDSNLSRVNWWSILNTLVLMSVGSVQVYMIRSLFEDNSRIGKIMRKHT